MSATRGAAALLALAAHVGSIVGANVMTANLGLVHVGFGLLVTAGTFAAGFALLARDFVHRYGGVRLALVGIGVGALLSWFMSTPALAVASTVAFAGAELVDLAIFSPARERFGFAVGALASNVVSAPLDTVIFLHLAGFGIAADAVAGQFVAKVVWATAIPLAIYIGARCAVLRQPLHLGGA